MSSVWPFCPNLQKLLLLNLPSAHPGLTAKVICSLAEICWMRGCCPLKFWNPADLVFFHMKIIVFLCWVPFWCGNLFWGKFLPQAPELKELQLDFQYFDPVTWRTFFPQEKALRFFFQRSGKVLPSGKRCCGALRFQGSVGFRSTWSSNRQSSGILELIWKKLEWRMRVGAVVALSSTR